MTKLNKKTWIIVIVALVVVALATTATLLLLNRKDDPVKVTIYFNSMGGEEIAPMQVERGTDARALTLPVAQKDDHVFLAWYIDESLTTAFFDTEGMIKADTTLYAGYEVYEDGDAYVKAYDVGETTLDISPDGSILVMSAVELTNDNLYDHITVTNRLEVSGGAAPLLSVAKADKENVYRLVPDGSWPEGGMFILEAAEGIRFVLESDGQVIENDGAVVAAPKVTLLVDITEEHKQVEEADGVVRVEFADYETFAADKLVIKAEAASKYAPAEGMLLKVMQADGSHQYIKAGACQTDAEGKVMVTPEAALPGEVFSTFDFAAKADQAFLSNYVDDIDKETVLSSLTSNPNFVIMEDLAVLSAIDYVNERNIAQVGGVTLLSGKSMGDVSGVVPLAQVENFDLIWEVVDGPAVLQLPKEYKLLRTGVSFDVTFDHDTYARITLEVQTGSSYGLLTHGHSKKLVPVSDVWLNARLKADYVTVFKFNIVMHDGDKVYDASEEMNDFGKKDASSLVAKYKELINLDTDKLKIIDEDIYTLTFSFLDIIVLRVPFGLEVEIDLNGAFSTELINRVAHFYGVNGSVGDGFDFWDAHCWEIQYEKTAYYGKFDISIGVRSGITIGLAGLDTLGRLGLKAEIGVYYQFLGYGYSDSFYKSWNEGLNDGDEAIKRENISSRYTSATKGAIYNELGLYLQFGIYVESDIFRAKAEAETPQVRIKLMEQGNLYDLGSHKTPLLPLGFSEGAREKAQKALVIDEHGVQLEGLPYLEVDYLDLKTGNILTRQVALSEFKIKDCYIFYYERTTGMMKLRPNAPKDTRMDSGIRIQYVDDSLYYIDDYLTKYVVMNGNTKETKYKGAYTELEIPVTYLPSSLADGADRLDETYTVSFRMDGSPVKSLEVMYGSTIYMTLAKTETSLHDYVMSGNQTLLNDPDISLIRVPTALYHTPITEDTSIELEVDYYGVPITVKWITGVSETDGALYRATRSGQIVWCRGKLYDQLAEMATDPHENIRFVGWRDANTGEMIAEDRLVRGADGEALVVEAVYDTEPITITVNIEALNDGIYTYDATTLTYDIQAGESILAKLTASVGAGFRRGNWAMYVTAFEKYAETFAGRFFEDQTLDIAWAEMAAEYKVTFDPNGGIFPDMVEGSLTDGAWVLNCAKGYTFTKEMQAMLSPQKADATAAYDFVGWYYIKENGEKAFGIKPAYEDRTYYAEWLASEKYFTITLNGVGTADGREIVGTFLTGRNTHVYTLRYSEIQALAASIKSGNHDPILVPTAGEYVFDGWVLTAEDDGHYTFTAAYKKGLVNVTIRSDGPCGSEIVGGTFPAETVTDLTLTISEWAAMKARIDAGDYTDLPTITPLSEAHLFEGWRVATHSALEYEIIPIFLEDREITITISPVGDHNGTAVPGTLSGSGEMVLNRTAADAFVQKIYNADYSELPTVTPDSDEYIFDRWQVSYPASGEYRITPVYTRNATATVTYEFGRGSNSSGITGTETYTLEIIGETLDFSIQEYMQPMASFSVDGYNESGHFTDYACFEDEHYYYVFSGWRTSDGETSWSLRHKDSVTITAEYARRPKAYCVELVVDFNSSEKELFVENGQPADYVSIRVWGAYGEAWSEFDLPIAVKQTSDDSPYTYQFSKWVSVDTGADMPATVSGGGRYQAVFAQETKPVIPNSVTVTFDAGVDGYFLSTGERYKVVEFASGTLYDDVAATLEKPIRNDANYKFHDWVEWWYGGELTEDLSVRAVYWNTSRECLEGEEDLIQVLFDAGEGAYFEANYNGANMLVYPELDPRYYVHAWEEGTLFYSGEDPADSGYTAGSTHDVAYFEQFVIVKDGQRYTAKWDLTTPFIYTWDVDKVVITYTELIPYNE